MRTFEQIIKQASEQRYNLLMNGHDPQHSTFFVTEEEVNSEDFVKNTAANDVCGFGTICGMKLHILPSK